MTAATTKPLRGEHLFAEIIEDRLDFLETKARELSDAPDARQPLAAWLRVRPDRHGIPRHERPCRRCAHR